MKALHIWFGIALLSIAGTSFGAASDHRLMEAVKRADVNAVRSLLAQHVDPNLSEADGSTALPAAAQRDTLEIANLLIAAGANVKASTRYNITPLSLACTNGNAAMIESF